MDCASYAQGGTATAETWQELQRVLVTFWFILTGSLMLFPDAT